MNPLKFRRLWTLIGYGLVVLVVVLSLTPSLPPPVNFPWGDKVSHVLGYGVHKEIVTRRRARKLSSEESLGEQV